MPAENSFTSSMKWAATSLPFATTPNTARFRKFKPSARWEKARTLILVSAAQRSWCILPENFFMAPRGALMSSTFFQLMKRPANLRPLRMCPAAGKLPAISILIRPAAFYWPPIRTRTMSSFSVLIPRPDSSHQPVKAWKLAVRLVLCSRQSDNPPTQKHEKFKHRPAWIRHLRHRRHGHRRLSVRLRHRRHQRCELLPQGAHEPNPHAGRVGWSECDLGLHSGSDVLGLLERQVWTQETALHLRPALCCVRPALCHPEHLQSVPRGAHHQRSRHRRVLDDLPGLYRRNFTGEMARTPRHAVSTRHRHRHFPHPLRQQSHSRHGRRRLEHRLRLALDAGHGSRAGGGFHRVTIRRSRKPALARAKRS